MAQASHVDTNGAGLPIVLLHGWAMHSGIWGSLATELASQYRVHAIDLPGHGLSTPIDGWTLDRVVAAVRASVQHESQPLTLVGWSLGGMVALRWAQFDADRVARLVLVSTTPRFVAGDGWDHAMSAQTLGRFGDEMRASYRSTIVRFLSLQLQGTDAGRAALAALRRRFFDRGHPTPSVLCDALAMLAGIDLRDAVSHVQQPALVIAGDRDRLVPIGAAEWLAARMPTAHLAPIAGAAHVPFLSHPRAFADALDRFLRA